MRRRMLKLIAFIRTATLVVLMTLSILAALYVFVVAVVLLAPLVGALLEILLSPIDSYILAWFRYWS